MKPIWVFGRDGQLGFYLLERLGAHAVGFGRAEFDQAQPESWMSFLDSRTEGQTPHAVINAGAYTKVDLAETETEICNKVNADTPAQMAVWCARNNVPFVHFSTDYVYSGRGDRPWIESDPTLPLNHYGRSKLEGEQRIVEANPKALIFRTSWVYSHRRPCFVLAVLKKARETDTLQIVRDQVGSPTYADHLAELTLEVLRDGDLRAGIFNLCDDGFVSRLDFAKAILEIGARYEPKFKNAKLVPTRTADFPAPAERPLNSRLDLSKAKTLLGLRPRPWRENLELCLERHYAERSS